MFVTYRDPSLLPPTRWRLSSQARLQKATPVAAEWVSGASKRDRNKMEELGTAEDQSSRIELHLGSNSYWGTK